MSLLHRLQALKQRRRSGHGHKVGHGKPTAAALPALPLALDAPVVQVAPSPQKRRPLSGHSAADVLPTIDYTFDVGELDAAPSLVSSSSIASDLTLADYAVDDGLTAWGLPKVVGLDNEDPEDELYLDCVPAMPPQAQPSRAPQAPTRGPTRAQLQARATQTLVYAALLTKARRQQLQQKLPQKLPQNQPKKWFWF